MEGFFAFLLLLFSVLVAAQALPACTSSTTSADSRYQSCQDVYRTEVDLNVTRVLDSFAGKLSYTDCIAHCGCDAKKFAGFDPTTGFCFCGDQSHSACSTDYCLMVFSTTGIPPVRLAIIPSKVEVFDTVSVSMSSATNVNKFAFVTGGKVALSDSTKGSLGFTELGTDIKAVGEVGAYWGCRTPEVTVNVYAPLNASLQCQNGVLADQKFECYLDITQGSEITKLVWKMDGIAIGEAITHVAEPMLFAIGGEMILDRFRTYPPSYDISKGESAAFINLNWEFAATAVIMAFEAHITRKGTLRMMILRPQCDKGLEKRYCHSLKSCVDKSFECGPETVFESGEIEFYAPPGLPVFCASVERFMSEENTNCPGVGQVTKPLADYKVMYEVVFNATQEGLFVYKLPMEQQFLAYPGYVLGWMPGPEDPGDIAYANLDPEDDAVYPVFRYDEIYTTFKKAIFSADLPSARTERVSHLLNVHAYVPTRYMKEFTLPNLGQISQITVELESKHSKITTEQIVSVQDAITAFDFTVSETKISTTAPVVFTVTTMNAKLEVKYAYHFGESPFSGDFDVETKAKTMSHIFEKEGTFVVTVKAFNLVSSKTKNITIETFVAFKDLGFITSIEPTNTKNFTSIAIYLEGGGHCNVTYDFGDGSSAQSIQVAVDSFFVAEFRYAYKSSGDYVFRAHVSNGLGSKSVAAYSVVEDLISEMKINTPAVLATNVSYQFSMSVKSGTNVTYVWHWNDGTGNSTSLKSVAKMSHVFGTYGNKTIYVLGHNLVSSANTSMFVIVQDKIEGLRYEKQSPAVVTGTFFHLYVFIKQGTGINMKIDFNYGSGLVTYRSGVAYNVDKKDGVFIAIGEYKYVKAGEYPFFVQAWNHVSDRNVSGMAIVEDQIEGFSVKFEHKNKYIEVNETIQFIVKVTKGTNVLFQYDFDDSTAVFSTSSLTINKTFLSWKVPFNVTLKAFNNVTSFLTNLSVPVQKPVTKLTMLRVWIGPANASQSVPLKYSLETGDDFICEFTVQDAKNKLTSTYADYLDQRYPIHSFTMPGVYTIEVTCKNRLYAVSASTVVSVFRTVTEFDVKPVFGEDCGMHKMDDNGVTYSDTEKLLDIPTFSLDCSVMFKIIGQTGNNITYTFKYSDGTVQKTAENRSLHTFWTPSAPQEDPEPDSKIKACSVEVTAENPVHKINKFLKIRCVERSFNVTVKSDAPARISQKVNFTISIEKTGYKSCLLIDYGDDSTLNWVGKQEDCGERIPSTAKAKPDLLSKLAMGLVEIDHIYSSTRTFTVTVKLSNEVNEEVVVTLVNILDKPCDFPVVSWSEPSSLTTPRKVMRSDKYTMVPKSKIVCERTKRVGHYWRIFRVLDAEANKEEEVVDRIPTTINDTVLKIGIRSLEYGLYRINYNASMWMVEGISTAIDGYIKITPSPMVAKFSGGTGRAVGQGSLITIDASPSGDPDEEPTLQTGILARWYCMLETEDFPNGTVLPKVTYPSTVHAAAKNFSINATTSGFTGCFGNGPGYLFEFDNKLVIQINTSFMPVRLTYSFRLDVEKNMTRQRKGASATYLLAVKPGEPPQLLIKCHLNCKIKVNSDNKLSIMAWCTTCTSPILYYWTVYKALVGDTSFEEISEEEATQTLVTPRNSKNLVIQAGKLDSKYQYKFKCEGYISADLREYGGFTWYAVSINTPPEFRLAKIIIRLAPGHTVPEPLKKIFRLDLRGFVDEDGPLTYRCSFQSGSSTEYVPFYLGVNYITDLFLLPAPEKDSDGITKIKVEAMDTFGGSSEPQFVTIKVRAKEIETSELSNILSSDGPPADSFSAVMIIGAVSSSMGTKNSTKGSSELLTKCANYLIDVEFKTVDDAAVVLQSMNGLIDDISPEAKKKASDKAADTARLLTSDMDPAKLDSLSYQTISLVDSAKKGFTDKSVAKKMEENSRGLKKKMGMAVAANKVPGEPPSVIKTEKSQLSLQSVDGGNPSKKIGPPGTKGGFGLPSQATGNGSATPVSTEVGENNFGYLSSGGSAVSSPVYTCNIGKSGEFGKTKKVSDLSEPIELEMENAGLPVKGNYSVYCSTITVGHQIVLNYNMSTMKIVLEPESNETCLRVLIKKGIRPTLEDYHWNFTVPQEFDYSLNRTNETDLAHEEEKWQIFMDSETLNYTAKGVYYFTVLQCNSSISCPPVNFSMWFREFVCLYFDESIQDFSTEGCKVTKKSSAEVTACQCTHLTSFGGGGVFAKPNPIDFSKALAGFSNLGENPVVFSVVMTIIGLYFILIAWCRRMDKRDADKIGVCPLEDNHPSDNYSYEIGVQTGFANGCSTTADVFIVLIGTTGESTPRQLKNPNRKCFNKGDTDQFLLATPYSLGMLKAVEIWHNNAGASPGWFCLQVQVRDAQTDKRWVFVCNKWLDVAEEDGLIKRKVEVAGKYELTQFDFLFAQTARKNLYDGHIWFSIVTRPPRSTFTRCQRLACCFSLLLTTMLANAMFYQGGPTEGEDAPPPENALHLGPITISVDQIRIGITSSLVVVPVNVIIAALFQKAGPKPEKGAKYKKGESGDRAESEEGDAEEGSSKYDKESVADYAAIEIEEESKKETEEESPPPKRKLQFLQMLCIPGKEADEEEEGGEVGKKKGKKKPKKLPYWVIYISYFLVFVSSSTSAFFVCLYGFQFGKKKSEEWISSMMISFWQSVLVIQPVKVIALSVFFALIIKDPSKAEEEETTSRSNEIKEDEEANQDFWEDDDVKKPRTDFKLPDEKKLEEARQKRLQEKKMKAIIREIVIHLMFLMLCLFVGYSNLDSFSFNLGYLVRKQVTEGGLATSYKGEDEAITAEGIANRKDYWTWVDNSVIPFLFPDGWYNGDQTYSPGFVADSEASKVLALARFRQLRVRPKTCTKHPVFENIVSQCIGAYSWTNEDQEEYSDGWQPPYNMTVLRKNRKGRRKAYWMGMEMPWKYQSVIALKNFPFLGKFATYGGSSYAVSIGPDQRIAKIIVDNLKEHYWIDRYTRAVFIEANIYNANTNLMLIITFLTEVLATGGYNYYFNVQSLRLFRYNGGFGGVVLVVDFIFIIVTIINLYKTVKGCRKHTVRGYLSDAWCALHFLVTVFSVCTIVTIFARVAAVIWATGQYKNDPEVFVSFAYVGLLEYFVMAFIGFVVFFTNLEFLRLLRFNRRIGLLTATMRASASPLLSFGIMFIFLFLAFVSMGHFLWCDKIEDFRNVINSFIAMMKMFLGQFDFYEYSKYSPILGPLLFFSYMVLVQMILINVFVGIVCETFEDVRSDAEKQPNEHEILSFMTNRLKKITSGTADPSVRPIYREWKPQWQITLEEIEEKTDNVTYLLSDIEAQEIRQTKWFDPEKADERRRVMLMFLIGTEEFLYENEICDAIPVMEKKFKGMNAKRLQEMAQNYIIRRRKRKMDLELAKENLDIRQFYEDSESDYETDSDSEYETEDEENQETKAR